MRLPRRLHIAKNWLAWQFSSDARRRSPRFYGYHKAARFLLDDALARGCNCTWDTKPGQERILDLEWSCPAHNFPIRVID